MAAVGPQARLQQCRAVPPRAEKTAQLGVGHRLYGNGRGGHDGGQRIEGLAAVQGETITVLQSDGSKVPLRKKDVEQQFASLVSVMPEKLLDSLTKTEIADLFAFLESEPEK